MALSAAELELEAADYLPAREVMTNRKKVTKLFFWQDNSNNINVGQSNTNHQVGLVNVGGSNVAIVVADQSRR